MHRILWIYIISLHNYDKKKKPLAGLLYIIKQTKPFWLGLFGYRSVSSQLMG